jgi:proteasome lid subunit RPN8/RPN11
MIQLLSEHLAAIVAHARESAPAECCGLLAGDSDGRCKTMYPLRNVALSPEQCYEAAPEELFAAQREIRERGDRLVAIYHSHPRATEPAPSETDVRLAYYPAATYLIVGLGGREPIIRAFRICEQEHSWETVEYEIADG